MQQEGTGVGSAEDLLRHEVQQLFLPPSRRRRGESEPERGGPACAPVGELGSRATTHELQRLVSIETQVRSAELEHLAACARSREWSRGLAAACDDELERRQLRDEAPELGLGRAAGDALVAVENECRRRRPLRKRDRAGERRLVLGSGDAERGSNMGREDRRRGRSLVDRQPRHAPPPRVRRPFREQRRLPEAGRGGDHAQHPRPLVEAAQKARPRDEVGGQPWRPEAGRGDGSRDRSASEHRQD